MIRIKPFVSYRPQPELVQKVAALPYDVVTMEEAKKLVQDNPYSFLNVDKYEVHIDEKESKEKVYQGAEIYFKKLIKDKIMIFDSEECIYIYGMQSEIGMHYGIISCINCEDYNMGYIKRHEKVREEKMKDRNIYINSCNYQMAPITIMHNQNDEIKSWISSHVKNDKALYKFEDEKGKQHIVFRISDNKEIDYIRDIFKRIDTLYLADGHHRTHSLAEYAQLKRKQDPSYSKDKNYNYLLGVMFGREQLSILSYNRVIRNISGLNEKEIFDRIREKFDIVVVDDLLYVPYKKNVIGMRYRRKWYELKLKESFQHSLNKSESLDVNILQNFILGPIFKIIDPTNDANIEFVGGDKGIEELNRRTEEDMDIAFSLFATDMDDFIETVNSGELMPPKSTWFEPKIRRGLFVYEQ